MKNKLLVAALLVGSLSAVSLATATSPVTAAAVAPIKATNAQLQPMWFAELGRAFINGAVTGATAGGLVGSIGTPFDAAAVAFGAAAGAIGDAAAYSVDSALYGDD